MKTIHTIFRLWVLIAVYALAGCQSNSSEKLKEEVTVDDKLDQATEDFSADMERYKQEVVAQIAANERSIQVFKAEIATSKNETKAKYNNMISELAQKNTDLKRQLDEFKNTGKDQWDSFRTEFDRDMQQLSNDLNDLVIDNKQ